MQGFSSLYCNILPGFRKTLVKPLSGHFIKDVAVKEELFYPVGGQQREDTDSSKSVKKSVWD